MAKNQLIVSAILTLLIAAAPAPARGDKSQPEQPVARAEFLQMLEGQVPDVKAAAIWGKDPSAERSITRAEAGALAAMAKLAYPESDTLALEASLRFSDLPAWHSPAKGWLGVALSRGLISGYPDGSFRPDDPVTRAQAGAMLERLRALPAAPAAPAAAGPAVAAHGLSAFALAADGIVWTWGANDGSLGDGTTLARLHPVALPGLDGVSAIATADNHRLALRHDGTVWAWGDNSHGQLGIGEISRGGLSPRRVRYMAPMIAVAAGQEHSLALSADGMVWAWGRNQVGQLGTPDPTDRPAPEQVAGLSRIVAVAAGNGHSLALDDQGVVLAWGDNSWGQLGDGTQQLRSRPEPVAGLPAIVAIEASAGRSLAIDKDGRIWQWGGDKLEPTVPVPVPGLTGVTAVCAGWEHALALRADGTVWAWGSNHWGKLGDGTESNRPEPVPVTGLSDVVAIGAGWENGLAVTRDGAVWAWGLNPSPIFGDTARIDRTHPAALAGLTLKPQPVDRAYKAVPFGPDDVRAIEQAQRDIPRYRQGDLTVIVTDEAGRPVPGVVVQYRQVTHSFKFGVEASWGRPAQRLGPLQAIGINAVTQVWPWDRVEPTEGHYGFEWLDAVTGVRELAGVLDFRATSINPLKMGDSAPDYLKRLTSDQLAHRVAEQYDRVIKHYAGTLHTHEAFMEPDLYHGNINHMTRQQQLDLFAAVARAIRLADPDGTTTINFSEPCPTPDVWDPDDPTWIRGAIATGVDFDTVGLQMYYNGVTPRDYSYHPPRRTLAEISACVDRYSDLVAPSGKRLGASEVAVPSSSWDPTAGYAGQPWSEDLQAQYLTAIYTILFSKEHNTGITWWDAVPYTGFMPNANLVDENGKPKKAFWALRDLLARWTTSGEGTTGPDGRLALRGFGGEYELVVTSPATGTQVRAKATVAEQAGRTVTVALVPQVQPESPEGRLSALVRLHEQQGATAYAALGKDFLTLAGYYRATGEWRHLDELFQAGAQALAIREGPRTFAGAALQGVNGAHLEGATWVIPSRGMLVLPLHLPRGTVRIDVVGRGHAVPDQFGAPDLVIGAGDKYSELIPDGAEETHRLSVTLHTSGSEELVTIRNHGHWFDTTGAVHFDVDQVTVTVEE